MVVSYLRLWRRLLINSSSYLSTACQPPDVLQHYLMPFFVVNFWLRMSFQLSANVTHEFFCLFNFNFKVTSFLFVYLHLGDIEASWSGAAGGVPESSWRHGGVLHTFSAQRHGALHPVCPHTVGGNEALMCMSAAKVVVLPLHYKVAFFIWKDLIYVTLYPESSNIVQVVSCAIKSWFFRLFSAKTETHFNAAALQPKLLEKKWSSGRQRYQVNVWGSSEGRFAALICLVFQDDFLLFGFSTGLGSVIGGQSVSVFAVMCVKKEQ